MKFKFKIQEYQTKAVDAIVKVFEGQPYLNKVQYTRDIGIRQQTSQMTMYDIPEYEEDNVGFENANIVLSDEMLLGNIRAIQTENNIKLSDKLVKDLGRCSLDIEMETGTGKTYVYIKSIFELNKKYGWNKFIVIVPSIAIREGVKKSFEMTQDHFMDFYNKKARFFIYNSSRLSELDTFASSNDIQVMIINSQAFAASLKEDGKSKDARIIYSKRDEFASRKPIDVISANKPILILDEPQKLGGDATQKAMKRFNPLFAMSFSATHKKHNNLIYVLDALEAFNQKLVKKIEVKGFELKNLRGTGKYLYLSNIVLSTNKPPMARIEFERNYQNSINRESKLLKVGDNLYHLSAGLNMPPLEQYKGYVIKEINPINDTVTFLNGEVISARDAVGDVSERDIRRIQIRETILSHFEKEEENFYKGIKTLSLFFIDEVAKYRKYDEDGNAKNGEYAEIFEKEYTSILNDYLSLVETPYIKYLQSIETSKTHNGYFSIDKKTNRMIDGSVEKRGEMAGLSNDISAYELILKNKERLLSFDEPTRFIFSHSALREGWDNPNVFQICTLKHSDSTVTKRQEVGRGMRLCVNSSGDRMDKTVAGIDVHELNKLTVIASDSYADFIGELQKELKAELYDRPTKASKEYFVGKVLKDDKGNQVVLDKRMAGMLYQYLSKNDYIDYDDNVTDTYRSAQKVGDFSALPEELQSVAEGVHKLIQSVFDENIVKSMFENAGTTKITENKLNDNFYKKEFQILWNYINHKYAYRVDFDSKELINNAIKALNDKLFVTQLKYVKSTGEQKDLMEENQVDRGDSFKAAKTETITLKGYECSTVKYDLVGMIATGTKLTRKTIVAILKGITAPVFGCFHHNPEEFIRKAISLINEQKATQIVDDISYNQIDGTFDSEIFTAGKMNADFNKAFKSNKHIQDYVISDGTAEKSVERRFAEDLEEAQEVCVYAKLPRSFYIPTPVGNYSPDWAIAFSEGSVKHIFFVAETKGTLESLQLRPIETAKIRCARKLFNICSTSKVKYHDVTDYQDMLNIINNKL